MIRIERHFIERVRAAATPTDLHDLVQRAIQLEHSTIPPYLTAMFSLAAGKNERIAHLIRSIVVEEMLHMCIASNILIAIGGRPAINRPDFIPVYPGPLPMSIGGKDFTVGIRAFSKELVAQVFMKIEEPEHPIPVQEAQRAAAAPTYGTIGEFYAALKDKLRELVETSGTDVFVVGPDQQVLSWFPGAQLFPIVDLATAEAGIDLIVEQGEGTATDPFDAPDEPAHYYRFGEIVHGREIVATETGYAWAGAPVPFDATGVFPLKPDCKIADFAPGTQAHERILAFATGYSSLLNVLHTAFNGRPDAINDAMGVMYNLKVTATQLMTTPVGDGSGLTVGPSFEYVRAS